MKKIITLSILLVASTCFAQMYTVTELGSGRATAINASGQVVGYFIGSVSFHGFRTAPSATINPAHDDVGTFGTFGLGAFTIVNGINASGQVVGYSTGGGSDRYHGFRTSPNSPINPDADDIGSFDGSSAFAMGINDSGQVVGYSFLVGGNSHAFRTAPNSPINVATDDLGTLGRNTFATSINSLGQVVGYSRSSIYYHAFRTAPNSPINPATDDISPPNVGDTFASAINVFGQVVGSVYLPDSVHAFRTGANAPINLLTDDLGTFGGTYTQATAIDDYGQVVGSSTTPGDVVQRPFLYSNGKIRDVYDLIPNGIGCELFEAVGLNNAGQIAVNGWCGSNLGDHVFLLTPVYKARVQQPINADGSSVFKANRGVVATKFAVTQYGTQTSCTLPATIAVIRTAGGTLGSIDENTYSMAADNGSNFRIDSTACQYVYNLPASALGAGAYRVDISINGIIVGHGVFALK